MARGENGEAASGCTAEGTGRGGRRCPAGDVMGLV